MEGEAAGESEGGGEEVAEDWGVAEGKLAGEGGHGGEGKGGQGRGGAEQEGK